MLDVSNEGASFDLIEGFLLFQQQASDHGGNLLPQDLGRQSLQRRQVELLEQLQVHPALQRFVGIGGDRISEDIDSGLNLRAHDGLHRDSVKFFSK